jgi:subtilisin family serine protease
LIRSPEEVVNRRILLLTLPAFAACTDVADEVAGPSVRPLTSPVSMQQVVLADRYIVVFRDDVQNPGALADALAAQFGGSVHFRYAHALKGFAATLPAAAVAGIAQNPNVAYIEPDGIATANGTDNTVSSWGLDRIDQRDLPRSFSYTWNTDGTGVRAYILDTGIRTTHAEFGGTRASVGFDALGGTGQDCHGHGTHVAGTVAGAEYGVARGARVIAVRVLDCAGNGAWSWIIAGIDWVKANHIKPAVANMSLGGGYLSSVNTAVSNAVSAGVTFALSAGNSNANACNYSPASTPTALTVAASDILDARASYSNYGTCVDVFAPGTSITSAWATADGALNTISGTSMASPHVAGVAALYLSANPTASPAAVASAITGSATPNKILNPGTGSPNLLLYSLLGSYSSPTPLPPPPTGLALSAVAYKVKGLQKVDLTWSGGSGGVDILRGTTRIAGGGNSGTYSDHIDLKGGGVSYTYKVCNVGTLVCSAPVTVSF